MAGIEHGENTAPGLIEGAMRVRMGHYLNQTAETLREGGTTVFQGGMGRVGEVVDRVGDMLRRAREAAEAYLVFKPILDKTTGDLPISAETLPALTEEVFNAQLVLPPSRIEAHELFAQTTAEAAVPMFLPDQTALPTPPEGPVVPEKAGVAQVTGPEEMRIPEGLETYLLPDGREIKGTNAYMLHLLSGSTEDNQISYADLDNELAKAGITLDAGTVISNLGKLRSLAENGIEVGKTVPDRSERAKGKRATAFLRYTQQVLSAASEVNDGSPPIDNGGAEISLGDPPSESGKKR